MKLLFLLLICALCGCSMHTTAYRAMDHRVVDMGRIEDGGRLQSTDNAQRPGIVQRPGVAQISDFGGNTSVAYAATEDTATTSRAIGTARAKNTQTMLSEVNTSFANGTDARECNITIASQAINNTTLKPGEVFSFNDTVGPTNKKAGFRLARIFIKGRDAKGYGGGVCQVSSTLHKAAKDAGLEITERHPHSKPVGYVKEGEDAATSYGQKDLKIKNDKEFDILIESSVEGEQVTVRIKAI